MPTCVIIEDDFAFAIDTKIKAEEIGLNVVDIISKYEDIQIVLSKLDVDVILSDVKLGPNLYAYNALKGLDCLPPIIFFSSYIDDQLYQKSKVMEPYIYLIKPFDKLTLQSSVDGALRSKMRTMKKGGDIHREDELVFVRSKGKLISIDPNEVTYVHSEGNYCYVYMDSKKIAIRSSIKNVMDKFRSPNFYQVHRAYMINTNYIKSLIVSESVVLILDQKIPIGRKYKKGLIDKLK